MKKDLKIEESEVLSLLNDDLRNTITVYLNGKIIKSVDIFSAFPLEFLGHLTFVLTKKNYFMDDFIFNEGDDGKDIFFIT